jgi:hypothetical protein
VNAAPPHEVPGWGQLASGRSFYVAAELADLEAHASDLEHPADLAWNLFTAVYIKAGGFPWAPVGIPEGTCHLGATFFRPGEELPGSCRPGTRRRTRWLSAPLILRSAWNSWRKSRPGVGQLNATLLP